MTKNLPRKNRKTAKKNSCGAHLGWLFLFCKPVRKTSTRPDIVHNNPNMIPNIVPTKPIKTVDFWERNKTDGDQNTNRNRNRLKQANASHTNEQQNYNTKVLDSTRFRINVNRKLNDRNTKVETGSMFDGKSILSENENRYEVSCHKC